MQSVPVDAATAEALKNATKDFAELFAAATAGAPPRPPCDRGARCASLSAMAASSSHPWPPLPALPWLRGRQPAGPRRRHVGVEAQSHVLAAGAAAVAGAGGCGRVRAKCRLHARHGAAGRELYPLNAAVAPPRREVGKASPAPFTTPSTTLPASSNDPSRCERGHFCPVRVLSVSCPCPAQPPGSP